jgi:hypothetical protein
MKIPKIGFARVARRMIASKNKRAAAPRAIPK